MSYYEQYKYTFLPKLRIEYQYAYDKNDVKKIDKIHDIIYNNKRLREFQKKEFWDIARGIKPIYGKDC